MLLHAPGMHVAEQFSEREQMLAALRTYPRAHREHTPVVKSQAPAVVEQDWPQFCCFWHIPEGEALYVVLQLLQAPVIKLQELFRGEQCTSHFCLGWQFPAEVRKKSSLQLEQDPVSKLQAPVSQSESQVCASWHTPAEFST